MVELNKIYNEDCLETMRRMDDNSVDCAITSPPYNAGDSRKNSYQRVKYNEDEEDWMDKGDYFDFITKILDELIRVTKYHIFFNVAEVRGNKGITKLVMNKYWDYYKETFLWHKVNPNPSMNDLAPTKDFEFIYCLSKDRPDASVFSFCDFHNTKGHDNVKTTIYKLSNATTHNGHNFAYPETIPSYFVKWFTKPGSLIYAPFMGSGTTAIACIKLDRNWIGSEISPKYCEMANKRIEQELSQTKLDF